MKKPGGLAIVLGAPKSGAGDEPDDDEKLDDGMDGDGERAMSDMIDALNAGDAKGAWEAFKAAKAACDSEPESY